MTNRQAILLLLASLVLAAAGFFTLPLAAALCNTVVLPAVAAVVVGTAMAFGGMVGS